MPVGAKGVLLLHADDLCFKLLSRLLVSMHVCTEKQQQQQQQHQKRNGRSRMTRRGNLKADGMLHPLRDILRLWLSQLTNSQIQTRKRS